MESGAITDEQLKASSSFDNCEPDRGRLHLKDANSPKQGAWSSNTVDENQWLQINLLEVHTVTGVATQGRNGRNDMWVKTYQLQYRNDGGSFQYYREASGNTDKVRHNLHNSLIKSPSECNTFYLMRSVKLTGWFL